MPQHIETSQQDEGRRGGPGEYERPYTNPYETLVTRLPYWISKKDAQFDKETARPKAGSGVWPGWLRARVARVLETEQPI